MIWPLLWKGSLGYPVATNSVLVRQLRVTSSLKNTAIENQRFSGLDASPIIGPFERQNPPLIDSGLLPTTDSDALGTSRGLS